MGKEDPFSNAKTIEMGFFFNSSLLYSRKLSAFVWLVVQIRDQIKIKRRKVLQSLSVEEP